MLLSLVSAARKPASMEAHEQLHERTILVGILGSTDAFFFFQRLYTIQLQ